MKKISSFLAYLEMLLMAAMFGAAAVVAWPQTVAVGVLFVLLAVATLGFTFFGKSKYRQVYMPPLGSETSIIMAIIFATFLKDADTPGFLALNIAIISLAVVDFIGQFLLDAPRKNRSPKLKKPRQILTVLEWVILVAAFIIFAIQMWPPKWWWLFIVVGIAMISKNGTPLCDMLTDIILLTLCIISLLFPDSYLWAFALATVYFLIDLTQSILLRLPEENPYPEED